MTWRKGVGKGHIIEIDNRGVWVDGRLVTDREEAERLRREFGWEKNTAIYAEPIAKDEPRRKGVGE